MKHDFTVPMFVRGEVVTDDQVQFASRLDHSFAAPDPAKHAHRLPLRSPM